MSNIKKNILHFVKNNKKILLEIVGIFLLIFIYEIIALCINDNLFMPNLFTVFRGVGTLLTNTYTYEMFGESFIRTILALGISFLVAFVLGSLAGYIKSLRYLLNPLIGMMKLIPTPCIVYLIFLFLYRDLYFGSIIITFIVIFPILYESFIIGHDNINESIKMSLRLEGYSNIKSFFKVILPESSSYIYLGITNSVALGVKVSIMSEILIGSSKVNGIGTLIKTFRDNSQYDLMIALIILILIIFLIFDLLANLVKKIIKK